MKEDGGEVAEEGERKGELGGGGRVESSEEKRKRGEWMLWVSPKEGR